MVGEERVSLDLQAAYSAGRLAARFGCGLVENRLQSLRAELVQIEAAAQRLRSRLDELTRATSGLEDGWHH